MPVTQRNRQHLIHFHTIAT